MPTTYPTQNPASPALELGFGTGTIAIMVRETHNEDDSANIEYIPSEAGADAVAVISNPGKRLTVDGWLLSGQTVPKKGQTVTLNSVVYLVESCQVRRTSRTARIALTLYKPDNTTWATAS